MSVSFRRRLCLWMLGLSLSLPLPGSSAGAQTLFIATEDSPPFNMPRGGEITGIATDIVREALARAGIENSISLLPWQRAYTTAQRRADACVYATTLTEERRPLFKWIGPLVHNTQVLFGRVDRRIRIESLADLGHYLVGGYEGDAVTVYLESHGVAVRKATSDALNLKMLQMGRIDLWATGEAIGGHIAKRQGATDVAPVFRVQETSMYLACNPAVADELVAKANAALEQMRRDGTTDRIAAAYR